MFKYMYLDESGDCGIKGSKYLLLSALLVDNIAHLDRIIKNTRRNKFKKELKKAQEIKANKSSKELIQHLLLKLNTIENARIFYIVLEKKKIFSGYLKKNSHKLYNYVAGKLAKNVILNELNVEIRIDKSKGKQLLQDDFDQYFLTKLQEKSDVRKVTLHHSYSHFWSGLQFADLLAWSCFQKFEHDNSEYVDLLDPTVKVYNNIIFVFFATKPTHVPKIIIKAIQKVITPFGEFSEEYLYNGMYDVQVAYLKIFLRKQGFPWKNHA